MTLVILLTFYSNVTDFLMIRLSLHYRDKRLVHVLAVHGLEIYT